MLERTYALMVQLLAKTPMMFLEMANLVNHSRVLVSLQAERGFAAVAVFMIGRWA